MALLNKDPSTYEKEKERFLQELTHFHETRGTPSRRPPKINGYEIDLCMLYNLVTSRGGWVKVNSRNEWDEILSDFDLPKRCVNSSVALKQIYLRYLDRYEKIHFLGEVGERGADDDEDSRHRRWSARSLHSVPLTYNHAQHLVNESLREYNGLSVDLYKPTEYEKLALSLISPLPNEQDFAINVCTLLSNEGKHSLKLEKHPRLLHSLLAHAAVFSNSTLRQLFTELYGKDRGHSMNHLWRDTVPDPQILRLADESQFSDIPRDRTEASGSSCKVGLTLDQEDQELFCVGRTLGIQDYVGQRVCQIASIVRNLSFINENVVIMGNDITFLRFVLLCCGSKWNGLQQLGWDMLGNIASEVSVQSPLIDDVLNMASKGLLSQDRAIIIASLEILNKLAQCEKNEDILLRSMRQEIYDRICSFLTLHDIMLLVYTLECLNSISSLGEKACNAILRVRGSLDVLVSLITVEAQSYGPKACIQMRVVETVSGSTTSGIVCQPSSQATTVTSSSSSVVVTSTTNTSSVSSLSTTMLTGVSTSSLISSTTTPLTQTVLTSVATSTTSVQPSTSTTPILPKAPVTPVVANAAHATQQVAQENEQFALAWLRSTFEPQNGAMIEQAELYKQYINYCAKIGRRGVIAPLHFPRCVRSVFGGTIGPKLVTSGESTQKHFYEGIQLRAKPLIPQVCQPQTTSVSTATVTIPPSPAPSTPSPILKAQLSAPPKPTSTPNSMALKVTQRQQQQKLLLQQQSSPPKTVPPPTATASFGAQTSPIEDSLLVNPSKITSTTTTYQAKPGLPCKVNGVRSGNEATEKIEVLQPNGSQIFSPSSIDSINRPPPLAPLSTKFNSVNSVAVTTDVTGPNPINSGTKEMGAGTRDDIGDNSMGSLDGFLLNGIPSSIDSSETTNIRETPTKSVMLADLLEKNIDKNEPPVLNGSLRIGDKGLELIQSTTELVDEKPSLPPPPPLANILPDDNRNMNGVTEAPTIKQEDVKPSSDSLKRPAEGGDEECSDAKKPHLNGEVKEEPLEECNVSSTAANLYAAFAADALEDEPLDELPPQPVIIAPTQPRQILVAAGGQLAQRVVVGGQHYVVAQSQAALVQGQTQTVLVAQTPQQQGTTAKTIIILQPQTVATASPQPQSKVIVQRLQSPPPVVPPHPPPLPSSPMLTATQSTIAAPIVRTITPSKPTPPPPPPPPTPSPTSVITAHKNFKVIKPTTSTTVTTNSVAVSTSTHSQTTTVQASSPAIPSVPAPCATPVTITTPSVTSVSVATTNSSTQVVIPSTSNQLTSKSPVEQQGHFLCEWRGCMRNFKSGHEVYMHACEAHCPQGSQEIQCLWERCDAMKRKRFSLMTHLYDKHCNTDVMRMMAVRRKQLSVTGRSEIPAPSPATPHPGYAPNAAFHAIKRHALEFVNPKELQDDNEGPVTKSIRLTAAMILRNLVIYSTNGRRHLTRYEAHLASVALSNVESSRTIAHVLYDMSQSR